MAWFWNEGELVVSKRSDRNDFCPGAICDRASHIPRELQKPMNAWTPLEVLSVADEPNLVRRLEVELPVGVAGSLFLRVQHP